MRRKTLILVNPAAGGGRSRGLQPRVAAYLARVGFLSEFHQPRDAADLEQAAAEAARSGYDCIATLGGDGTFQRLAQGTLGSNVALGYIPAGGGNDVALALGIPPDPIDAAHLLAHGKPRPVDVLRARCADSAARIYLGGGGLGLDAQAARWASGPLRGLPGAARYVGAALLAFSSFMPPQMEVELDGGGIAARGPALLIAAVNTPMYGAGIRIAPEARPDDSWLDVIVVAPLGWARLLDLFPIVLQSGDIRGPELQRFRARRVRLSSKPAVEFHGDGEVMGKSPVEIECLAGAIRVIAPPG